MGEGERIQKVQNKAEEKKSVKLEGVTIKTHFVVDCILQVQTWQ